MLLFAMFCPSVAPPALCLCLVFLPPFQQRRSRRNCVSLFPFKSHLRPIGLNVLCRLIPIPPTATFPLCLPVVTKDLPISLPGSRVRIFFLLAMQV